MEWPHPDVVWVEDSFRTIDGFGSVSSVAVGEVAGGTEEHSTVRSTGTPEITGGVVSEAWARNMPAARVKTTAVVVNNFFPDG